MITLEEARLLHEEIDFYLTREMDQEEKEIKQRLTEIFTNSSDSPAAKESFLASLVHSPLYLFSPSEGDRQDMIRTGKYEIACVVEYPKDHIPRIYVNKQVINQKSYKVDVKDQKGNTYKELITGEDILVMLMKHEMLHIFLNHLSKSELIMQNWWKEHYPNDPKWNKYAFYKNPKWQKIMNKADDWDLSMFYTRKEKIISKNLKVYGQMLQGLVVELDHPEWAGKPLTQLIPLVIEAENKLNDEGAQELPPIDQLANFDKPGSRDKGGDDKPKGGDVPPDPNYDPDVEQPKPTYNGEFKQLTGHWVGDEETGHFVLDNGDEIDDSLYDPNNDKPTNYSEEKDKRKQMRF